MLQINPDVPDRRTRILDAAERCFVRSGFHRTTMHDVAAEAGMSAGNLYRTFTCKDAIVEGLCERDRRDLAADFATFPDHGDFMTAFEALGRKHFEQEPREKAVLCLQIWAEATRSAAVGGVVAALAEDIVERLAEVLRGARDAGHIAPALEPRDLAILIVTMADGLFVRRAVLPSFDAPREVALVLDVICALASGAFPASGARRSSSPSDEATP